MKFAIQVVDMNLDLTKALRRQRQTMSQDTPMVPPSLVESGRPGQGMEQAAWPHMLNFGTLTGITSPKIRGNVVSLARPVRKPPHQGGGFVASAMHTERSVMTFSDNALAETAPTRDAQAIRLALTASIE